MPATLLLLLAVLSGVATATTITQARSEAYLVGKTKRWVELEHRKQGAIFRLDDGSGPIAVDPTEGSLDCELQQTYSGPPDGGGVVGRVA